MTWTCRNCLLDGVESKLCLPLFKESNLKVVNAINIVKFHVYDGIVEKGDINIFWKGLSVHWTARVMVRNVIVYRNSLDIIWLQEIVVPHLQDVYWGYFGAFPEFRCKLDIMVSTISRVITDWTCCEYHWQQTDLVRSTVFVD